MQSPKQEVPRPSGYFNTVFGALTAWYLSQGMASVASRTVSSSQQALAALYAGMQASIRKMLAPAPLTGMPAHDKVGAGPCMNSNYCYGKMQLMHFRILMYDAVKRATDSVTESGLGFSTIANCFINGDWGAGCSHIITAYPYRCW